MTVVATDYTRLSIASGRGAAAEGSVVELHGRPVAQFSIAGGAHRGSIGTAEGDVVERTVTRAVELGVPVVGVLATSGADVHEGVASLHAWGRVARALTRASGSVPVVLVVSGPCVSGPALLLGLADAVVFTAEGFAYVSGPAAVAEFTGMRMRSELLGGAAVHARRSGVASMVAAGEAEAMEAVATLLGYLPSNNVEEPPVAWCDDPVDRPCSAAAAAVPATPSMSYDVRVLIGDVVDTDSLLEIHAGYAPNIVVGFATVGGRSVGIVANQPCERAGTLDIEASRKAARFVQLCDAFNVPIVTFVDTPGFEPGKDLEWRGMIRHGAELVHAYAEATVVRICVIVRKAYGGAYIVMDSKTTGNDVCVAWPGAEIAVMGAPGAVQILDGKRLAARAAGDPEGAAAERAALEAAYRGEFCTPAMAAQRGFVDEVIDPADTRRVVAAALRLSATKRDHHPHRRHSNSPL